MKTIKTFFLIIFSMLYIAMLGGCGKSMLDGGGEAPEFDSGPHIFSKTGGEKIIKAKNNEPWSFLDIAINGIFICGTLNEIGDPNGFLYCDSSNIDENGFPVRVEPKYPVKSYPESEAGHHSLVGEWFTIEQLDKMHIRIKMDENKTGEDIYIKVRIFSGDATEDPIIIEQKAE